ncbi:MAG: hypothetical protein ACREAF_06840 [Nitrosopumilaceae archaeon]
MFNSATQKIGNYKVQVATIPEIPATGEKTQILFRVLDDADNEVEKFRMGVRIFYKDVLVDTIPPQYHEGGHWDTNYVFRESGNHIFRADLYDVAENSGIISYTFNISTLNPFGYIFIYVISAGGIACLAIIVWILISRKKRMKTRP